MRCMASSTSCSSEPTSIASGPLRERGEEGAPPPEATEPRPGEPAAEAAEAVAAPPAVPPAASDLARLGATAGRPAGRPGRPSSRPGQPYRLPSRPAGQLARRIYSKCGDHTGSSGSGPASCTIIPLPWAILLNFEHYMNNKTWN